MIAREKSLLATGEAQSLRREVKPLGAGVQQNTKTKSNTSSSKLTLQRGCGIAEPASLSPDC